MKHLEFGMNLLAKPTEKFFTIIDKKLLSKYNFKKYTAIKKI